MRIALRVEYNGAKFYGWQAQHKLSTLQSSLEQALSKVANEPIRVSCAGRTDAGVHATHQVVHFDTQAPRKSHAWILGTNSYLPASMSVHWAKVVEDSFHARFSAMSRRYQYIIYNKNVRSGLFAALTAWVHCPLDATKMHIAAKSLIGEQDFTSFRSAECQSKTPNRHVFAVEVVRKNNYILIDIIANAFLHHMVRNIVGVLIEIGAARKQVSWCAELLKARNRNLAGKIAPPQGLYLTGVRYADVYQLPSEFASAGILNES